VALNLKWLPNSVSLARLALTPVIAWLVIAACNTTGGPFLPEPVGGQGLMLWAFGLYVFAALTDWIDGWLARTLDAKSALGAQLDLLGDKVLVGVMIVAFWIAAYLPSDNIPEAMLAEPGPSAVGLALLLALTGRDLVVTRLRARAEMRGVNLSPTLVAKSKTAVVMTGIGLVLAGPMLGNPAVSWFGFAVVVLGAFMSLYTAAVYFKASATP
jgi:cardiolipin synthase (CMP-forming)